MCEIQCSEEIVEWNVSYCHPHNIEAQEQKGSMCSMWYWFSRSIIETFTPGITVESCILMHAIFYYTYLHYFECVVALSRTIHKK